VDAYGIISAGRRSEHVVIADVAELAGVGPEEMRAWLVSQARAGKVDIALGEPTLATQRQLRYALPIQGRNHLYMMVPRTMAS
jgi:hypothetical protein